jgi:hypothetical protein
MNQRVFSILAGGDIPKPAATEPRGSANYAQVVEDLGVMIKELRAQLAESEAARQAAEARAAALDAANARAADLEQRLAVATAACKTAAPAAGKPQDVKPVAYEVMVTQRDGEGRLSRMELVPSGTRKTAL